VLEYLLKQESVLINAVDRFGGTPYVDAIRKFLCHRKALFLGGVCELFVEQEGRDGAWRSATSLQGMVPGAQYVETSWSRGSCDYTLHPAPYILNLNLKLNGLAGRSWAQGRSGRA
jgi:hypothetical protein